MPVTERIQRRRAASTEVESEVIEHAPLQRGQSLDGLLDEIDEVLESNAEEYVRGFVQKGGQ